MGEDRIGFSEGELSFFSFFELVHLQSTINFLWKKLELLISIIFLLSLSRRFDLYRNKYY